MEELTKTGPYSIPINELIDFCLDESRGYQFMSDCDSHYILRLAAYAKSLRAALEVYADEEKWSGVRVNELFYADSDFAHEYGYQIAQHALEGKDYSHLL